jgi:hypothetical protein
MILERVLEKLYRSDRATQVAFDMSEYRVIFGNQSSDLGTLQCRIVIDTALMQHVSP